MKTYTNNFNPVHATSVAAAHKTKTKKRDNTIAAAQSTLDAMANQAIEIRPMQMKKNQKVKHRIPLLPFFCKCFC